MTVIIVTEAQRTALMLVLIEAIRDPDKTQAFLDVLTDETITLGDLLTLINPPPPTRIGGPIGQDLDWNVKKF